MTKISKFTNLINEIREIALAAYNNRPEEDERINTASDNIKAYLSSWKNSFIKLGCDADAKEIDPWLDTDYHAFLTTSSLSEIFDFIRWFDEEEILLYDMQRYLNGGAIASTTPTDYVGRGLRKQTRLISLRKLDRSRRKPSGNSYVI